jgi:hypothetical protein
MINRGKAVSHNIRICDGTGPICHERGQRDSRTKAPTSSRLPKMTLNALQIQGFLLIGIICSGSIGGREVAIAGPWMGQGAIILV